MTELIETEKTYVAELNSILNVRFAFVSFIMKYLFVYVILKYWLCLYLGLFKRN